ncbi:MAG: guanylate kinase [Elusimicrobiota bacterium]
MLSKTKSASGGKTGIPIIISAPSGAGKTTLIKLLVKKVRELSYSVSATTRPPFPSEKDGKDYFFISEEEFLQRKKLNEFIETALVHGHHYGTLKKQLDEKLKAGKDIVLDVDVMGAFNVKKHYPNSLLIFIAPPSMKILEERIRKRHRDSEEDIQRRLKNARKEMGRRKFYDYIIINASLNRAFSELKKIVKHNCSCPPVAKKGWYYCKNYEL